MSGVSPADVHLAGFQILGELGRDRFGAVYHALAAAGAPSSAA